MKTTKRILGILLALALTLTLALPAAAADPIITGVSPQNPVARTGKNITLTVEAELPEGDAGPLSYQWYQWADGDWEEIAGATAKSLTVTATAADFVPANFDEVFDTSDGFGSLETLLFGLIKQYRVTVFCAGGQAAQDMPAAFRLGFFDSINIWFLLFDAMLLDMMTEDGLADDPYFETMGRFMGGFVKVLFGPFLLFIGIDIWFMGNILYYALATL